MPPMPADGRSLDTADPDSVWAAQNVIDVFASEVAAVSQHEPGYCDVALDGVHDGLTVWWHGRPSAAALEVVGRAQQARITTVVLPAAFDRGVLHAASDLLEPRMQELGITARAVIDPGIPLHFTEMAAVVAF